MQRQTPIEKHTCGAREPRTGCSFRGPLKQRSSRAYVHSAVTSNFAQSVGHAMSVGSMLPPNKSMRRRSTSPVRAARWRGDSYNHSPHHPRAPMGSVGSEFIPQHVASSRQIPEHLDHWSRLCAWTSAAQWQLYGAICHDLFVTWCHC